MAGGFVSNCSGDPSLRFTLTLLQSASGSIAGVRKCSGGLGAFPQGAPSFYSAHGFSFAGGQHYIALSRRICPWTGSLAGSRQVESTSKARGSRGDRRCSRRRQGLAGLYYICMALLPTDYLLLLHGSLGISYNVRALVLVLLLRWG